MPRPMRFPRRRRTTLFRLRRSSLGLIHSLKEVGLSLDLFFNLDSDASLLAPPSPVLSLPELRKGDSHSPEKIHHHLPSRSDSGSHLHFHSDDSDGEDGSGSESLHHHDVSSPVHHQQQQHMPYGGYFSGYENVNVNMNVNYMKKQMTPYVVYTQSAMSAETLYMGESSAPSSYYLHLNYSINQSSNPSYSTYNSNNGYPNYGGGGGYCDSSSPPAQYGGAYSSFPAVASTSKAPPPPPSPPNSSPWDFLNTFERYEKFYPPYTPSRNSREVREEEGIPDLEDEAVKEVHGDQKLAESGRSSYSKPGVSEEDAHDAELEYRAGPSVGTESDPVEYEVHVVDKKVVDGDDRSKDRGNAAGFKPLVFKGDLDVVREIQVQFERASESWSELAKFLEVEKLPYKRKHGGNHG